MGSPIVFGFPSLYYLLAKQAKITSWNETFMNELGPFKSRFSCSSHFIPCPFCIFGTIGGIRSLVNDIKDSGHPFHC